MAELEAVQQERLVEAGEERFDRLAKDEEIVQSIRRELQTRLAAWTRLRSAEINIAVHADIAGHADIAFHVAKKWAAKAVVALSDELELRERGNMEYLEAVDTSSLFWQNTS